MSGRANAPLWLVRAVWLAQPLAFVTMLDDATAHLPDSGRVVVAVSAWTIWAAVLLAALVPSTVSITTGRLAAPMLLATAALCGVTGVAGWRLALGMGAAVVTTLVWFSGETGTALAQGSAYGSEQRFPLKPPVPLLVPMFVSWAVLCASTLGAIVLLANRSWGAGIVVLAVALAVAYFVGPRFHQLSRRWLVVVPAGVVVHDPMMLTENALFRTTQLAALHLAPADTEAADLTGGTPGAAIEIVLHQMDTIVRTGTRSDPAGTALHVLSVLVSPTRPGKVLTAAAGRRLPVG
ncbi:unannotated protein [freshwater metagenome]|uniref:Unannotated protein n=1 Tax=freshwater metagenome TaxID=449393 RepID=A0A6J7ETL2_9ZZZZ|nr:hypothetical protein [Actinomycetota bacterium]